MWDELLLEAGLNEREVRSIMILGSRPKMKASELAKELNTTRLDAYNSLSRLQEMGIVTATADRPMLLEPPHQRSHGAHHPIPKATTRSLG